MLGSQARRFTEALVARHAITRQVMDAALTEASTKGRAIDEVLMEMAEVSAKDLAAGHSAAAGLNFIDFDVHVVQPEASGLVPEEITRTHQALGVMTQERQLYVAFPVPADGDLLRKLTRQIAERSGYEVIPVGAEANELRLMISETMDGASAPVAAGADDPERELVRLIERVIELGGSDLHLSAEEVPHARVLGVLAPIPGEESLSASHVRRLIHSILSARQIERFEQDRDLDAAYAIPGRVRLRVNAFVQRGAEGAVLRIIPAEVIPFENLGIPPAVARFADLPRGLVLVTGPTGSGKSTTLASLIDLVNQHRNVHIVTIEDPIEFVHRNKRGLVNQREVGDDTDSFSHALRQAMRQDPDVILVGEMRDLETVATAISAAETGHLVFATLHTQDSAQTIDRIVDVFPPEQQQQVRTQVANTIQGIMAQQLVPTADGRSRVAACELLFATPALRALIRDGKVHQIPNMITQGRSKGMQTIDEALIALVRNGTCTAEEAIRRCRDVEATSRALGVVPPEGTV